MTAVKLVDTQPQQEPGKGYMETGMENTSNTEGPGLPREHPAYFSCWDIHAYYGESYIVQGVSFDIREGEILALLGRNGAGKTSTLRAIARVDDPALRHGEIWLDHKPLHEMKAHEAAQNGIGLVPEDRRIIQGLTVEENLQLSQIAPPIGWSLGTAVRSVPASGGTPQAGSDNHVRRRTADAGRRARPCAGRQAAAAGRAPMKGLAPVIVQEIEKTLEEIKSHGMTTVIVEQNAIAALHLADRAIILDMGQVVFNGTAKEVLDNEELRHEYLAI